MPCFTHFPPPLRLRAKSMCHHSGLWDRVWSIKSDLPRDAKWAPPNLVSNERLFTTQLLMRQLLLRSPHIRAEADAWSDRVNNLLLGRRQYQNPRQ